MTPAAMSSAALAMSSALPADFLGEGVAQADCAVEHRAVRGRIRIAGEIALALELHRIGRIAGSDGRLDPRVLQNFQRVRIEVSGEIAGVRVRLGEQLVVDA